MGDVDKRKRFSELAQGLIAGDSRSLEGLERLAGEIAHDGQPSEIAWTRLGLSRLLAHKAAHSVAPQLKTADAILEGAEKQLRASRARRRREETRRTVKERVLNALDRKSPGRPTELADACEVDIYQVSRALRDLRSSGLVERTEAPEGADGRAVWYRVTHGGQISREASGSVMQTPAFQSSFAIHLTGRIDHSVQVVAEVDGQQVWPAPTESQKTAPEPALERLAASWMHLVLEEGLPFDLEPGPLDRVWTHFESSQDDLPRWRAEERRGELVAFSERHDLSHLLATPRRLACWLVREGRTCWVLTPRRAHQVGMENAINELSQLGGEFVATLERSGQGHTLELAQRWAGRSRSSPEEEVKIATGLSSSELDELQGEQRVAEFWELDRPEDSNELLAAARMASGLPVPDIAELLETVRSAGANETPALDDLSREAVGVLAPHQEELPHEQGYRVADWLRVWLGVGEAEWVDVRRLLDKWNVKVIEVSTIQSIDAFACWGPRHGPLIAINTEGRHARGEEGRRATLAHEIAHLLVDRDSALPAAEVFGGRTAPLAEKRARAFTAELLLLREEAGRVLSDTTDPEGAVRDLRNQYGVSSEIIAWQARNSSRYLPPKAYSYLRSLVSRPWNF